MELENETRYPAALFRGCIDESRIAASLVVRRTFDLVAGHLVPAATQVWPVSGGPFEGPNGITMPGDELFYRGGVDVFVIGSAIPPGKKPVAKLDVSVKVGSQFQYKLAVFGERTWLRKGKELVPSDPATFTDIPLTLANAFGGKDVWDELPIPFPDNPDGKGYANDAESAVGKPLPNLEDPSALVRKWDDRPEPVGVGVSPFAFGPRARRTLEFDEKTGAMKRIDPKFFNAAFPAMIVPKVQPGDAVRVDGVSAAGPIAFAVPTADVRLELRFGDKFVSRTPAVDQVGIEPNADRIFVTYRYPFKYEIESLVKRTARLVPVGGGS